MDPRQKAAGGSSSPFVTDSHITFGVFQVDLGSGELRKSGIRIKLHPQPFAILLILLERPGEVVSREELQQRLWASDTFVDFEHGLNKAINKLREALSDDSESPRFIETLHRRGYRFIAPVGRYSPASLEPDRLITISVPSTDLFLEDDNSTAFAATKRSPWLISGTVFAGLVVLAATGFGIYSLLHRPSPSFFQNLTITQITHSGKTTQAAISPDGKYVASVMDDDGRQSLWLRYLPTGNDMQIMPPSTAGYASLTFSPDGNYIYSRKVEGASRTHGHDKVYRTPLLGGGAQTVLENIGSNIAFSSDGQHLAYVRRRVPDQDHDTMYTSSTEGDNEQILLTATAAELPDWLAWSPSGNQIAYSHGNLLADGPGAIESIDVRTRRVQRLVTLKDELLFDLHWSPDGIALFGRYFTPALMSRVQIGYLRANAAEIRSITRDTNRYDTLSVSADGRSIAAVQSRSYDTISILSKAGNSFGEPRVLMAQSNELNEDSGVEWGPDGGLFVNNASHLGKLGSDGKGQTQLLADSNAAILYPSICGRYLVLGWGFHAGTKSFNIWRTDADGSHPLKLTKGLWDASAVCSPDQKWVYYRDYFVPQIFRVLMDGSGQAEAVSTIPSGYASVGGTAAGGLALSPDGETLATVVRETQSGDVKLAIMQLSNSPRILAAGNLSPGSRLQFTPDGRSITYVTDQNGKDNLWEQPLDGSPGHAITGFKTERIWWFSMSSDGKGLAVLRGHYDSDAVVLQESK